MQQLNQKAGTKTGLIDHVFSWSSADALDSSLYKQQVRKIPMTFSSAEEYLNSFKPALIEETHDDIVSSLTSISSAPVCMLTSIRSLKQGSKEPCKNFYSITVKRVKHNGSVYDPATSDLIALTNVKPRCFDDLLGPQGYYVVGLVLRCEKNFMMVSFSRALDPSLLGGQHGFGSCLFGVFLMNMTTNLRIWNALQMSPDSPRMNIINSVLQPVAETTCTECCESGASAGGISMSQSLILPHSPNDSQKAAILNCISSSQCTHKNTVKLIWGPPGTGKTKTVGLLLNALLNLKTKTLICAPTNTAVLEVAGRLLNLVGHSGGQTRCYGLGDVVVSGNRSRMKIDNGNEVFLDVFLNHRVDVLRKCFTKASGWEHCMNSMIYLLKNSDALYKAYVASETTKQASEEASSEVIEKRNIKIYLLTRREFLMKEFDQPISKLKFCIENLYTHLPTPFVSAGAFSLMVDAVKVLESLKHSLSKTSSLDHIVSRHQDIGLALKKSACLSVLKSLFKEFSLPKKIKRKGGIKGFCLENAVLVFCTASGSSNLTQVDTTFDMVVIDEAAQLKECESALPLQVTGLRHAVLVGDERQLPAMVKSNISDDADFGRSLFERLVLLGHQKHLLNIQYRMHPSISRFPNKAFYDNLIQDAANVSVGSYERKYLVERMYGSYSFINVPGGQEEFDSSRSTKIFVEVAAIFGIVSRLSKACVAAKERVSIGVISPYKAQTSAIQDILAKRLSAELDGYVTVNVRSVDGFQGGEEDVIIFSSVRCNARGSIGFLSNSQRTNVALTRARHCLWILGSERTLVASDSIWAQVVLDAKERDSFYDVVEDKHLVQSISRTLLEHGRLDLLCKKDSVVFISAKWKVLFTSHFLNSMARGHDIETQASVLSYLGKLATGWRDNCASQCFVEESASQLLELYKVHKQIYLAWSIDICYEDSCCTQVLKVWDIKSRSKVAALGKGLGALFNNYTYNELERCKYRCIKGDIQLPMSWPDSQDQEDDSAQILSSSFASLNLNDSLLF